MKKAAVKGLVILAAVIALCMFFSGTIKNISTAKVKLVTARQGKLEENIRLTGRLVFPETEEVTIPGMTDGRQVIIRRVNVSTGKSFKKGDVLFEAEVEGYDDALGKAQEEADAAQRALLELEHKYSGLRLRRTDERWAEAYDALLDARNLTMSAMIDLRLAAAEASVTLDAEGNLPAKTKDKNLNALQSAWEKAKAKEEKADGEFQTANRLGVSDTVIAYITDRHAAQEKLDRAQKQIESLRRLAESAGKVIAAHDGYAAQVNVKAGDSYDGKNAALLVSAAKSKGVLRADTSSLERRMETGTQITASMGGGKEVKKKVTALGVGADGKSYLDVELSDKDITSLGGSLVLTNSDVTLNASYRASSSSTLLPASAVRGTGDHRYVYVIEESQNMLGKNVLKVKEQSVTVIAEVGSTISVEEPLNRQRIAYMEDRAISDGTEVMAYAE